MDVCASERERMSVMSDCSSFCQRMEKGYKRGCRPQKSDDGDHRMEVKEREESTQEVRGDE